MVFYLGLYIHLAPALQNYYKNIVAGVKETLIGPDIMTGLQKCKKKKNV